MKKYMYLILFVLLASMLALGCAEKPSDEKITKKITDDVKSNVKFGDVTNAVFDNHNETLTASVNINQKNRFLVKYRTLSAAIEVMQVAENYSEIKKVEFDGYSLASYGNYSHVLHLETRTGKGINWKTEIPGKRIDWDNQTSSQDFKKYSTEMFDSVEWYID